MQRAQVAVVGDFDASNRTHAFTNASLEHVGLSFDWVGTDAIDDDAASRLSHFQGVWIAPASPYRSMDGAVEAIRFARERGVPLVGT
jgi:CTP synthase (UTP-ammonia lyase)